MRTALLRAGARRDLEGFCKEKEAEVTTAGEGESGLARDGDARGWYRRFIAATELVTVDIASLL